jgi:hypothetical protein
MVDIHPYFKIYNHANFYMDGIASTLKSKTEWYWSSNGQKVSFAIPWRSGQPDNANGTEYCFGFSRLSANQNFGYSDFNCRGFNPLCTCERIDLYIP